MNPQVNPQVFPQAPPQSSFPGPEKHVNKTIIIVILAVVLALALGFAIWSFVNYSDQKTNVDGKISQAVATAQKNQADSDEAKFIARDKEPNRTFVGPDDYGQLSFNYPKTWSVYINKDASDSGNFEAYLNPVSVPPVLSTTQYALRVLIENTDYDKVIASYDSSVKSGKLKASTVTAANGATGTRLDGNFSTAIRGSAVIFKIRDKTVTIRTDADTFDPDFNALIATIKFNQ